MVLFGGGLKQMFFIIFSSEHVGVDSIPIWRRRGVFIFLFTSWIYGVDSMDASQIGSRIYLSGQIIATSHDLTPNGGLVREIPLFQGYLGWWNIVIWPDLFMEFVVAHLFMDSFWKDKQQKSWISKQGGSEKNPPKRRQKRRMNGAIWAHHRVFVMSSSSKKSPTYPWNIPQTLNNLFMREILSIFGIGVPGVLGGSSQLVSG